MELCEAYMEIKGKVLLVDDEPLNLKKLQEGHLEHAILEERAFTDNLLQNATVPIYVLDANHKILIWNRACEALTGFKAAAMIGTKNQWQPFYNYPRPTLADILIDCNQQKSAGFYTHFSPLPDNSRGLHSEGWFTNLKGNKRFICFQAAPIYDSAGELVAVIETLRDNTERKKIEGELVKEKHFSEAVINSLPGAFCLLNEALGVLRWNTNLEKISGYSSMEIPTMRLTDFFAAEDKLVIEHRFIETARIGKTTAEAYLLTRNGERIPYFFMVSAIQISDEPYLIVTGLDLVERYETEELLRKLSRAVEQGSSSIVITDLEGCIEYVNPSFLRMTDCSLEDVIGRNPMLQNAEVQLPDIFGASWETLSKEGEWHCERQNKRKSGETFWESVSISGIKNSDDIATHYLIVKEDITSRKIAEQELAESRAELLLQHEQLQNLFQLVEKSKQDWENSMDCIDDVLIMADPEDRVKRCNRALQQFIGKAYVDIIGKNWRDLLAENELNIAASCTAGTEICHIPSGKWFLFNSYPFSDSSNKVCGVVITLHDTTVVKRFTNELEKAYSDLKTTQAKVVQQEKMASIGQLAAGVAHEINNPMGFISSNLGTLTKYVDRLSEFILAQSEALEMLPDMNMVESLKARRKALKLDYILEDSKDLITESLEGAERVRTIVKNLKSFARVDEAERKKSDINECLTSTINIAWNELKYKASLVKELGDIPLIRCYPQQINQVFMNLLVNAAQAIDKQGEITVKTWHVDSSIYASVTDTGCGMTPAVMNRIFEPFYTTKDVGKGTGLGLSIIYDIIKNHNGEISVESEPGQGTTFTVRLPVTEGEQDG
jgi:two-component system, NtrC family, sensor kinase